MDVKFIETQCGQFSKKILPVLLCTLSALASPQKETLLPKDIKCGYPQASAEDSTKATNIGKCPLFLREPCNKNAKVSIQSKKIDGDNILIVNWNFKNKEKHSSTDISGTSKYIIIEDDSTKSKIACWFSGKYRCKGVDCDVANSAYLASMQVLFHRDPDYEENLRRKLYNKSLWDSEFDISKENAEFYVFEGSSIIKQTQLKVIFNQLTPEDIRGFGAILASSLERNILSSVCVDTVQSESDKTEQLSVPAKKKAENPCVISEDFSEEPDSARIVYDYSHYYGCSLEDAMDATHSAMEKFRGKLTND